jgi:hypothetical protein
MEIQRTIEDYSIPTHTVQCPTQFRYEFLIDIAPRVIRACKEMGRRENSTQPTPYCELCELTHEVMAGRGIRQARYGVRRSTNSSYRFQFAESTMTPLHGRRALAMSPQPP